MIFYLGAVQHYAVWSKTISEFGFDKSLGKNIFSPDVAQINSQLFRSQHDLFGNVVDVQRIHYCNFGLIMGRHKGMSTLDCTEGFFQDWKETLASVRDQYDELLESYPSVTIRDRMVGLFSDRLLVRLSRAPEPLQALVSLPPSKGGLGFPGLVPKRIFDTAECQLAHSIVRSNEKVTQFFPGICPELEIAVSERKPEFRLPETAVDFLQNIYYIPSKERKRSTVTISGLGGIEYDSFSHM
jgi:hypothetical protein